MPQLHRHNLSFSFTHTRLLGFLCLPASASPENRSTLQQVWPIWLLLRENDTEIKTLSDENLISLGLQRLAMISKIANYVIKDARKRPTYSQILYCKT